MTDTPTTVAEAWGRRFDFYCERMGPEFWAEPMNAISNGGFWIAGIAGLVLMARTARWDWPAVLLALLVCVIGTGSFLFHTFATPWALALDTGPILAFILGYFAIAMNRLVGLSWLKSLGVMILFLGAFLAVSYGLRVSVGFIVGGSQSYFPAFFGILGVGYHLWRQGHPGAGYLLIAANLFAISLFFRAIDGPICREFPLGTHFLWHLFNASVLGTLLFAVIREGRVPAPRALAAPAAGR
ncbi:MAG: hypothetical protein ACFBSD_11945 [Paracoccaceae bacterium]